MGKPIVVVAHCSDEELFKAMKSETRDLVKRRIQLVYLVQTMGYSGKEAGKHLGFSQPTTSRWLRAYNEKGLAGLESRRAGKATHRKVKEFMLANLEEALERQPPLQIGGGAWDGPKVAAYLKYKFSLEVCRQTGWELLKRLGYSLQRPRPRHASTPEEVKEEFKKKLASRNRSSS